MLTATANPGGPRGYLGEPGMPGPIEQVADGLADARESEQAVRSMGFPRVQGAGDAIRSVQRLGSHGREP